jgi:epoxyqueuosine reductase
MKMAKTNDKDINARIIEQAINLGASAAGIANVNALKNSPSYFLFGKLDRFNGVGTKDSGKLAAGQIVWPSTAASVVVVGVEHPADKPELDWWRDGLEGGTTGNRILIDINSSLSDWLEKEQGFKTHRLSYHIEKGGIFLKDAAVMAGLGCIGKNNLLVNQIYGPRIRLRAILLDAALPSTRAVEFNPCKGCEMPCRTACPLAAFQKKIYHGSELGLDKLPGRSGVYSRQLCNVQMENDIGNSEKIEIREQRRLGKLIKYCRRCEFACPVGHDPIEW